jgi:hypothetical protein
MLDNCTTIQNMYWYTLRLNEVNSIQFRNRQVSINFIIPSLIQIILTSPEGGHSAEIRRKSF